MASNYLDGSDSVASALTYQQVQDSSSITTTSGTFSTMTTMSITALETGTYTIDAGADISINASGVSNKAEVALFNGATVIPQTTFGVGVNASGLSLASIGFSLSAISHATIQVTAGDVISFRFRRSSGSATVTATSRYLRLLKVG